MAIGGRVIAERSSGDGTDGGSSSSCGSGGVGVEIGRTRLLLDVSGHQVTRWRRIGDGQRR